MSKFEIFNFNHHDIGGFYLNLKDNNEKIKYLYFVRDKLNEKRISEGFNLDNPIHDFHYYLEKFIRNEMLKKGLDWNKGLYEKTIDLNIESEKKMIWYGNKDQLFYVFDWFFQQGYLGNDFIDNREAWLNECFRLKDNKPVIQNVKKSYHKKLIWHSTLTDLKYYFKTFLTDGQYLREDFSDRYQVWTVKHFAWLKNGKIENISRDSLNATEDREPYEFEEKLNGLKKELINLKR